MLSKKFSCDWFNFGIWRKQTFRYWPIWASYLVIWLLIAPNMLDGYYHVEPEYVTGSLDLMTFYAGRDVLQSLNGAGAMIAAYAGFIAMALYSYLYQSRSVNLFHSLPVRRETLFTTNFITGLSFIVIPNLIISGYFTLLLAIRHAAGDLVPILTWFVVTTVLAVFFFGLATLCAMGTAAILMMPVLYGIFNFLVVVIESVLRWLASMFLWGVSSSNIQYQKWSPLVYIFREGFQNNRAECIEYQNVGMHIKSYVRFADWDYVLLLGLAGLLFASLALMLYRRWQSESAGDLIAFSFLRPVFTYVWTAGCSLMLGSLLFLLLGEGSILDVFFGYDGMRYGSMNIGGAILFVLCMLAGGTVGYFSANMLHRKSFRVFRKKDWLGYGAFVLGLLLVVLCIKVDLFNIEGWTPDLEDVESISVNGQTVKADTESGKNDIAVYIRIHQAILDQKSALLAQLELPVDYQNDYIETLYLRYTLKDGRKVQREYSMRVDKQLVKDPTTPIGMLYAFMESAEKRMERSGLSKFEKLTHAKLYVYYTPKDPTVYEQASFYAEPETLDPLLQALRKDVVEGSIGLSDMFDRLYNNKPYGDNPYGDIWGELGISDGSSNREDFLISVETPNTLEWLKGVLADYLKKNPDKDPTLDDIIAGA